MDGQVIRLKNQIGVDLCTILDIWDKTFKISNAEEITLTHIIRSEHKILLYLFLLVL